MSEGFVQVYLNTLVKNFSSWCVTVNFWLNCFSTT